MRMCDNMHQSNHVLHAPNRWRSRMERTPGAAGLEPRRAWSLLLCMFTYMHAYSSEDQS